MRHIGIVGSEAAKFFRNDGKEELEAAARHLIRMLLLPTDVVVSGGCHLGGIDQWAIEEAKTLGLETVEYLPAHRSWEGGYKQRNIQIAERSDCVVCVTVEKLPPTYTGMTFPLCYHCGTNTHVKSGGCWTVKHARKLGKEGAVYVIREDAQVVRFS